MKDNNDKHFSTDGAIRAISQYVSYLRSIYNWFQLQKTFSDECTQKYEEAKSHIFRIQELVQMYNTQYKDSNIFGVNGSGSANSEWNKAIELWHNIESAYARLQSQTQPASQSATGLEGFNPSNPLGSVMQGLGQIFTEPYSGNNPQMAALFDLYMQLLGNKQAYDWQRSADDLAYQRTNFNTLLQQYMAAGMSRAAALSAASGGLPSVSGSSVGGSLSPNTLGGVAQAQNNAIAAGQLGVAQQNADTQLYGTMGQLHMMQQQYELERHAQEVMLWSDEQKIQAMKEIVRTWELTYSLHAMHLDVPLEATESQKTFKDWLRAGRDFYNAIINGRIEIDEDGSLICYLKDDTGTFDPDTVCTITQQELAGYAKVQELYEEIQKHLDNPYYGLLFEDFFMSNAGPRAYHQQEDYSELQRHLIAGQTAQAKIDAIIAGLEDENLLSDVNNQVAEYMNVAPLDDEHRKYVQALFNEKGLAIYGGRVCYAAGFEDPSDSNRVAYRPLSLQEMLDLNIVYLGYDIQSLYDRRATLQAASLQTDLAHYKAVFDTQRNLDRTSVSKSGIQADATEQAGITIKNTNWLRKASELDVIWNNCGFSRLAAGAGAFAVGGFKFGTALAAGSRARRMIQIGEQRVQAQQDMVQNRNNQYDVSDFDMSY